MLPGEKYRCSKRQGGSIARSNDALVRPFQGQPCFGIGEHVAADEITNEPPRTPRAPREYGSGVVAAFGWSG